jgi:hypothetical protein
MRRPGVRIPLPPVFARVVEESEDCRAEALAKADILTLWMQPRRATTRQANKRMGKFFYIYILQSERDEDQFYTGLTDDLRKTNQKPSRWPSSSHSKMAPMAIESLHRIF